MLEVRRIPTLYSRGPNGQSDAWKLPPSFIQEVRARASIQSVIEPYVQLKKSGSSLVGLCPFHKEKSPSFSVSEAKGFYHCFGCGQHGDAIEFLTSFAGQSFREAVEELAGLVGMALPLADNSKPVENYTSIHSKLNLAHKFFRHCLAHDERTKEYLRGRGVNAQSLRDFGISYAPPGWQSLQEVFGPQEYASDPELVSASLVREKDGRRYDVFRDRLMFSIRDTRGRIIGFGGRSMDESTPKYLNSPESPVFDKSSVLFGFHEARSAILAEKKVIVVEGYMDVVMMAQAGFKTVVATMGTACTPLQIERLCAISQVTTFTFDGDAAGQKAAWRALTQCLPYVKDSHSFRFCMLPDALDPDEYIKAHGAVAMGALIDNAHSLHKFLLAELSKRHNNLDSPEDKARFLSEGLETIRRLPQGSAHFHTLRNEISKMAQIGSAYLATMRDVHRRQAGRSDVWLKFVEAVRRFPCAARDVVLDVVNALSEEDYAIIEAEAFSSDYERSFWEEFLALPDMDRPADEAAVSAEDMARRDLLSALPGLLQKQLKKQNLERISSRYRRGEISEAEFIEFRSVSPSDSNLGVKL